MILNENGELTAFETQSSFPHVDYRQAPLVYHFGHTSPAENLTLYNHCISKLAAAVDLRCKANRKACVSGVIVNACGSVSRSVLALANRSIDLPILEMAFD